MFGARDWRARGRVCRAGVGGRKPAVRGDPGRAPGDAPALRHRVGPRPLRLGAQGSGERERSAGLRLQGSPLQRTFLCSIKIRPHVFSVAVDKLKILHCAHVVFAVIYLGTRTCRKS